MKYGWTKFVVQRMRSKLVGSRKALLPDFDALDQAPSATSGDGMIDLPVIR